MMRNLHLNKDNDIMLLMAATAAALLPWARAQAIASVTPSIVGGRTAPQNRCALDHTCEQI
jgi:hypothetical protein